MECNKNHHQMAHVHHSGYCNGKLFKDAAFDALKAAHCRITRPRLAVIECLAQATVPLSPKNIYEYVLQNNDDKIDQVSVYRILETFIQLNLIHQVFPSGDYLPCTTSCEKNSNHIILNCIHCGKVTEIDIDGNDILKIYEYIKNKIYFLPAKNRIQIDGMCHSCQ
ncbi:Fur family transcriptional regulator [Silvanigrella aquatica]|uniref:Ferric uptake regulation protein n=1 Tax=Silvanigrella aquatica TaxID=1915309 RepID=A0A1L4D1D0_9BACT|nr:transcriptional repressor [Silvanigrella aquatica]APJ04015.1 hypothetical protein AXG55_08885 [Silvanigrella aquatica]